MIGKKFHLLKAFFGVAIVASVLLFSLLFFAMRPKLSVPNLAVDKPNEKAFVVVTPSYNNKDWYQRNLDSVLTQKYSNFRLIYLDDASTDGTGELVREYIEKNGHKDKVTLIQNKKRVGALANFYRAISECNPREIVVEVDGDDWLADDQVLAVLNRIYQDPQVWVTYGQFTIYPIGQLGWAQEVPQNIRNRNAYREYRWLTTHLRTYYASLFQKIEKQDLLYAGDFFQMSGDLARMFPICEMAGHHCRYVSDVLYVYNIATPLNDHTKDKALQESLEMIIRTKKRYQPIQSPF